MEAAMQRRLRHLGDHGSSSFPSGRSNVWQCFNVEDLHFEQGQNVRGLHVVRDEYGSTLAMLQRIPYSWLVQNIAHPACRLFCHVINFSIKI